MSFIPSFLSIKKQEMFITPINFTTSFHKTGKQKFCPHHCVIVWKILTKSPYRAFPRDSRVWSYISPLKILCPRPLFKLMDKISSRKELVRNEAKETFQFSIPLILPTVKTFDNHSWQHIGCRYIDGHESTGETFISYSFFSCHPSWKATSKSDSFFWRLPSRLCNNGSFSNLVHHIPSNA